MACIQAVGLVHDRQAIDLADDLGPASKSMGLSGRLSPRSEQRQSFACSSCVASTDRRQACAHGRQIRIAFSPLAREELAADAIQTVSPMQIPPLPLRLCESEKDAAAADSRPVA